MAATAHGMLAAGVVASATVDDSYTGLEVINRDLTGEIWVRVDGIDPVPRGVNSYVVLGSRRFLGDGLANPSEVRMIAEEDRNYSVEGVS